MLRSPVRTLSAALVLVLSLAATRTLEGSAPLPVTDQLLYAWVDPDHPDDTPGEINDPSRPFRGLQAAIDAVHQALVLQWPGNNDLFGLVYALPGLYGPHGPGTSQDVLPIVMRDRVHVRGLGAARCIVRGVGTVNRGLTWPDAPQFGTGLDKEVLIDFQFSGDCQPPAGGQQSPPWAECGGTGSVDTAEVFDGFTLQGGDVQVLFKTRDGTSPQNTSGIVSNCLFDMRHDWRPDPNDPGSAIAGPHFGIMIQPRWVCEDGTGSCGSPLSGCCAGGYARVHALVANNTFIMAEWDGSSTSVPVVQSRAGAVGVINVGAPGCLAQTGDCDPTLRGAASPLLVNNLFRTGPPQAGLLTMAMLGVEERDTKVLFGAAFVQTNAFASNRTGSTNGLFWSQPVQTQMVYATSQSGPLFDCRPASPGSTNPCVPLDCCCPANPPTCTAGVFPATPAVNIWDGSSGPAQGEFDPGFVGEYLSTFVVRPDGSRVRDWRLLPTTPLADLGVGPDENGELISEEVLVFKLPPHPDLDIFAWDGDYWGNPRIVNGRPDIGFDEVHLMIVAGNYANDSRSHNGPNPMNPSAGCGTAGRYMLFAPDHNGKPLMVHGTERLVTAVPDLPMWTQPKRTLSPPFVNGSGVPDHRTRYIGFRDNDPGIPTPWTGTLGTATSWGPPGQTHTVQLPLRFHQHLVVDDECTIVGQCPPPPGDCSFSHFNMQAVIESGGDPNLHLWSNLQSEYR